MASPKPKPTALKLLAGNPGRRPLPTKEPRLKVQKPRPPAGLGKIARAEWNRIVPLLITMRVLTLKDRTALQCYCEAYQAMVEARDHIAKHGQVYEAELANGEIALKRNPATSVMAEQMRLMLSFAQEFGLTPSSQTKVASLKEDGAAAKDLW